MTITMKLVHLEVFKVGCVGGSVIDWKWYEIMCGERYIDMHRRFPTGMPRHLYLDKQKISRDVYWLFMAPRTMP